MDMDDICSTRLRAHKKDSKDVILTKNKYAQQPSSNVATTSLTYMKSLSRKPQANYFHHKPE